MPPGDRTRIADLASVISGIVGFEGGLEFDHSKPDGTPRKLLDVSRLSSLGWQPQTSLHDGITETYAWFAESLLESVSVD